MSGNELRSLQALASQHIAFSLTEACPLHCPHCIVSTAAVSQKDRYMPLAAAEQYASEMEALAGRGVRMISFTGGEPLLAPRQLRVLADAAAAAGMRTTVVTACHWSRTRANAVRRIRTLPGVRVWHLSTDIYHLPEVPAQNILHAAWAALEEGREASVRMAAPPLDSEEHRALCSYLERNLPAEVGIAIQPLTRNGRAADLVSEIRMARSPAWPCSPNGMVIRYDGTVAPCCAGLVDQRENHPFQYARATVIGVAQAHRAWSTDPLLQLIRTVGFAPVLQWLGEAFPEHPLTQQAPRHPCECCLELWRDPRVGDYMRRRAEQPQNRAKIAALGEAVFGERHLREELEAEAAAAAP